MNLFKKLFSMALAVVLMFMLAVPVLATNEQLPAGVTFTEVNEIVYAVNRVNVRKGPGMEYDIITTLSHGEAVRRTGIGNNGWSRVLYMGEEAYMHTSLITTQKPSNFGGSTLDDGALKEKMGLVNGLDPFDYTAESWERVAAAMTEAEAALEMKSQSLVDEAFEKLKSAIAELVKIDFTALDQALMAVENFTKTDAYNGLWVDLAEAIQQGQEALTCGDQAAVDAATQQIQKLLEQMKAIDDDRLVPDVIEKEVQVEVFPTDDFCNIPKHRVWPVIACASLAVNLCLLAVIGLYIMKKRKTQRDDTPLVDYDIDDDTF